MSMFVNGLRVITRIYYKYVFRYAINNYVNEMLFIRSNDDRFNENIFYSIINGDT